MKTESLRKYLDWLITPQDDREQLNFKKCVDSYIELKPRIKSMSREELILNTNLYLEKYNLKINE